MADLVRHQYKWAKSFTRCSATNPSRVTTISPYQWLAQPLVVPHAHMSKIVISINPSKARYFLLQHTQQQAPTYAVIMDTVQCRDCVSGAIHTGKPTGTEITYQGLPTYVTRPDEGTPEKGIIVFITDIFGWEFPNSRLLADKYAKKGGYTVYIPDFMRGQSIHQDPAQAFTTFHQVTELHQ